jgi:hypothetical protein
MDDFEKFVVGSRKTFEAMLRKKKIPKKFYPELEQVLYDTLFEFYKKRHKANNWDAYFKTMLNRAIAGEMNSLIAKEEDEKILLEILAD